LIGLVSPSYWVYGAFLLCREQTLEQLWLEKLRRDEIVLIDGGTGSELKRRGVAMHAAAWSGPAALTHPEILRELHADYIRAGADIITTNTFGTSRFVLEAAGLGRDFTAINRHAVAAALEAREIAADRSVAIAGSMSCLPPRVDRTAYPDPTTEQAAYRELAKLLAASGVDLIALEMIQDGAHGAMALTAALETGLPVWLGVSARRSSVEPKKLVGFDYPDRSSNRPCRSPGATERCKRACRASPTASVPRPAC
jgi:homocysteine S-methyltransferase